jgi:integrase
MAAGAAGHLVAWIEAASLDDGPVLRSVNKGGAVGGRMTPRAIQRAGERLARTAGVSAWRPHDMRRTWIGDLLDRGADLATVQALAGHADPATTARYDRRPAETRRRAARLLAVPAAAIQRTVI